MRKGHNKHQTAISAKFFTFSSLTLASFLAVMGFNFAPNASATDCSSSGSGSVSCDTIVTLTIPSSISITGSPSVNFNSGNDLTPGIFYTSNAMVYVTTNSGYGYTLSMQMSENQISGSTNTLFYNSNEYIPSITKVQKQAAFEQDPTTGGWGFALDATNFRPLPTVSGTTYNTLNLKRTHGVANADSTTLTFGVLPPTTVQNAIYQNIVTVTATANDSITLNPNLSVSGTPTKTHYAPGAYFNTDGLTIYAVYTDGKQVLLTDGQYVVNNGNPLVAGQTAVSITYTDNGSTASAAINGITVDDNTVNGDPVDNGTGNNNGASNGVVTTSPTRGTSGSGSGSNSGNGSGTSGDANSGNADPQGATDYYGSDKSSNADTALLASVLSVSAATATAGIIILAVAKRRREDEEESDDIDLGES